ncbi:MAG: rod shape-determining protein MreD, partial [Casimicrobiaceae bacterium]
QVSEVAILSAEYFHRRVVRFPLWQQALHVLSILLATQLVVLVLRLMSGASMPSLIFLLSSVSSALVWPVASMLLQWPQRVRSLTN